MEEKQMHWVVPWMKMSNRIALAEEKIHNIMLLGFCPLRWFLIRVAMADGV
jgi:hypothetical protein